jgi:Protein of unknown function (DUF2950)
MAAMFLQVVRSVGFVMAAAVLGFAADASAQQLYAFAAAASDDLIEALAKKDARALARVLGPNWKLLLPPGGIASPPVRDFLEAATEVRQLVNDGTVARIQVGKNGWLLPIPIVRRTDGWRFDAEAANEEIRILRIGRNELAARKAVLAAYDGQIEYASEDRNGDGVLEYAQKFISAPGKRDGLYWAHIEGEPSSPLGPLFASDLPGDGYYGYHYKILTAQGSHAAGGAYDYRIKGRLIGGFAVLAWPVRYGDTGVVSFMVNHDGVVFEKDLGPTTASIAKAATLFDPDISWQRGAP